MESIEIRIANKNDIAGASAVQHAVIASDHPYEYAQNILYSGSVNLVALLDNAVIGYISVLLSDLNPNGRHLWERLRPYIAFVGVLPEIQRRNVGTELVKSALHICDPTAESGLWLECPESSAAFYEKIGFVRVTPEAVQHHTGLAPKGSVYRLTGNSF